MSQLHLKAFLQDALGSNADFRASTSSLAGLVRHLRSTSSAPQAMSFDEALQRCSNFRAQRVSKYHDAIKRLVGVWGQPSRPYPGTTHGNKLTTVDINRIAFRGDQRGPDVIFAQGFAPKEPGMGATYRNAEIQETAGAPTNPLLKQVIGAPKAGDLLPASAVCVTPDLHVAALFPLPLITVMNDFKPTEVPTWVYMVHIQSGVHTHSRQVLDALAGLAALTQAAPAEGGMNVDRQNYSAALVNQTRINEVLQNIYGREMASSRIESSAIWFAFKSNRKWNKTIKKTSYSHNGAFVGFEGDYKAGGRYEVVEVVVNPQARFPNSRWFKVADDAAEAVEGRSFSMPTSADGFVPSTVQALTV